MTLVEKRSHFSRTKVVMIEYWLFKYLYSDQTRSLYDPFSIKSIATRRNSDLFSSDWLLDAYSNVFETSKTLWKKVRSMTSKVDHPEHSCRTSQTSLPITLSVLIGIDIVGLIGSVNLALASKILDFFVT